jgi:hypothetical protein
MLEIASTTTRTVRELARSAYSIRRWCYNFYNIGTIKRTSGSSYLDFNFLARNCMSNKDHRAKVACDEVTAVSDFLNGHDKAIPHRQRNAFSGILLVRPN